MVAARVFQSVVSLIEGDMQVRWTAGWRSMASGTLEGWCWNPAEPDARLAVEILVDGAVTGASVADQPRRDLERRGIGDGAHGFSIRIDPALAAGPERLVAVRVVGDGRIVGQQLVGRAEPPAADPAIDALDGQLRDLSADIEALVACRAVRPPSFAAELATLAAVLREPGTRAAAPASRAVAAARAVLARELGPPRPVSAMPAISFALARPDLGAALALLRMMEPHHELLLPDDPAEPRWALLAALTPAARIAPEGVGAARGTVAAVLDRAPRSVSALDGVLARLAAEPDGILFGGDMGGGMADIVTWPVVAATGLRLAASPATLSALGPIDGDLPARAVRQGRQCFVLLEPWSPPAWRP